MVVSCRCRVHPGSAGRLRVYLSIHRVFSTIISKYSRQHPRKSEHRSLSVFRFLSWCPTWPPPMKTSGSTKPRAPRGVASPRPWDPTRHRPGTSRSRRPSGRVWIRELRTAEWRTDLREALCQKPGQKNKMKHSSGPAGPRQLLANICTFGSRIIVSLLMRYFYYLFFFSGPVWL